MNPDDYKISNYQKILHETKSAYNDLFGSLAKLEAIVKILGIIAPMACDVSMKIQKR